MVGMRIVGCEISVQCWDEWVDCPGVPTRSNLRDRMASDDTITLIEWGTPMDISQNGVDSLESLEGYSAEPYECASKKWTVGYGHRLYSKEARQSAWDMPCSLEDAKAILREDLEFFVKGVNKYVKRELTQNQFDAIVSLVYNIGLGAFKKSTLLKRINSGNFEGVPSQMRRWNKSDGRILKGLKRRRETEIKLWNKK